MTEICISTAFIVIAAAWYFAARRCHTLPQGSKWLRGLIGAAIVLYASFAVVAYVHETAITDWATAFINVALVLLHLLAACIMSLLLWTVDRTIWVQLSIRDEPEEQQP